MHELGRGLIVLGLVLAAVGGILLLAPKLPFLGRLPGDFLIKRQNFTFFFPLATSILVSIVISLVLFLIGKLR